MLVCILTMTDIGIKNSILLVLRDFIDKIIKGK